jgi:hypothetical protein
MAKFMRILSRLSTYFVFILNRILGHFGIRARDRGLNAKAQTRKTLG